MDVAYDQITKESYPDDDAAHRPSASAAPGTADSQAASASTTSAAQQPQDQTFTGELRDAYSSFQSSAWGASLGSLWGTVRKQGETYYDSAKRELANASDASRGVAESDLANSTRTLTLAEEHVAQTPAAAPSGAGDEDNKTKEGTTAEQDKVPESLTSDIMKEANILFSAFRTEAATSLKSVQSSAGASLSSVQLEAGKRLKQVQAAEDAADAALLRFGGSVRGYLRDAITISAPQTGADGTLTSVLFESKDHAGRRMVHATRFDAQLHVVHANHASFTQDPDSAEFAGWQAAFSVEQKTEAIAADLAKYDALRAAMEALVPETVEYAAFWTRYYFLRHVIEEQERKRRELLKAAEAEEVGWDDDDDDDEGGEGMVGAPATPKASSSSTATTAAAGDAETVAAKKEKSEHLKPAAEGRRSNEQSVASDASYDIVSANASRGPGSPREAAPNSTMAASATATSAAAAGGGAKRPEAEEEDEEDWE